MLQNRKRLIKTIVILVLAVFVVYFAWGIVRSLFLESTWLHVAVRSNTGITGTVRLAQVSDLHRAVYGKDNQELVDLVASKKPDIILSTGDMIDVRTESYDDTVSLFARLEEIAPVVFSIGNHEMDRPDLTALLFALHDVGVDIVHNSAVTLHINGIDLKIGGLYTAEYLHELDDDGSLDILLCHFPHKLDVFAAYGVPLTFCGHTHGGQFRLPFLDIALYAPNQGLFPQYTTGLYEQSGSYMIVSRGLGNSSFPFRVHNPPEVIIADVTFTNQIQPIGQ